jgi:ATP-dependent RNA helicase DDX18/HAS1
VVPWDVEKFPTVQLEKLLQKNFYLHQSAKDGFRSYLQAYASYSLKKIFDIHKLDLAKVGKSFGFAVPPRVNVNMGGGTGGKRQRDRDEEGEDEEEEVVARRQGKGRRIETMGKKRVDKEFYKKSADRKESRKGQWSR